MTRIHGFLICFFICLISTTTFSQNFDETWAEFLENNKISNMSRLPRPDPVTDQINYAKFALMNTNNKFCQSKIVDAETYMEELQTIDTDIFESIPGFTRKMDDLEKKIEAYHSIDEIWNRFLKNRDVTVHELEEIYPPSTICEKRTLVKYSYMTAHYYLCEGELERSINTFENRTLKIAEKTTLRVNDVKGMSAEVKNMKTLYRNMSKLDDAWEEYLDTGVSPGFKPKLPLFDCYPVPNIKAYLLRGAVDICKIAPEMLEKIEKIQDKTNVALDREIREKISELREDVKENEETAAPLNKAWNSFVKSGKVPTVDYGYEYCNTESLIRAYIMDGYAYPCNFGDEMLTKIDSLRKADRPRLRKSTAKKINELMDLIEEYEENSADIDKIWGKFVANGNKLVSDYISTENYCDNIHQVKDWTMRGLTADCEEAIPYLQKIDNFKETFDFDFYKGLDCRVQALRIKVWECRHAALEDLAKTEFPDAYQERLTELMEQYDMIERPRMPDGCE